MLRSSAGQPRLCRALGSLSLSDAIADRRYFAHEECSLFELVPAGVPAAASMEPPGSIEAAEWSLDVDLQEVAELPGSPNVLEDLVLCGAPDPESTRLGDEGWGPRVGDKAGLSQWSPRADRDWIKESRQANSPVLERTYTLPEAGSTHLMDATICQPLPLPVRAEVHSKPTSLPDSKGEPEPQPCTSESIPWDRAFSAGKLLMESTKRARCVALPQLPVVTEAALEGERQKKRCVVAEDPQCHKEVRGSEPANEHNRAPCSTRVPLSDLQRWVPPIVTLQQGAACGSSLTAVSLPETTSAQACALVRMATSADTPSATSTVPAAATGATVIDRQERDAQPLEAAGTTEKPAESDGLDGAAVHHSEKRQKVAHSPTADQTGPQEPAPADVVALRVPAISDGDERVTQIKKAVGDPAATPSVASPQAGRTTRRRNYPKPKPRQVWTVEEHEAFTDAITCYGRKWSQVAQYVGTKTVEQTRSHAQKYFKRLKRTGEAGFVPPPRRPPLPSRPSILDVI